MAKGRMFNVDRWLHYSRQRKIAQGNFAAGLYGAQFDVTPAQRRRIKKKANRMSDKSVGYDSKRLNEMFGKLEVEFDNNPANHEIDCTCIMCIPGE
jgi:hypothetical protein